MSGIFGAITKDRDCAETVFYGTDYLSHLGTEFGGMAIMGEEIVRRIRDISQTQFKSKFYDDWKVMHGSKGIGVISSKEEQPICINSKLGSFALCTNGLIENSRELTERLLKKGVSFSEVLDGTVNPTELIAKIINEGSSIISGIEKVFKSIEGSCSLLVLNQDGIYAARDRFGYTTLVIARRNNDWAVTSETSSLPNLDFKIVKYLQPGEIVLINDDGIKELRSGGKKNQICAFLWIYTGFPASSYEGINVEAVRERCGRCLARRDTIKADMASGVPDSGITHAIGYAMESKLPYRRPLVKYTPGYGRSYTPPSQATRDKVAKMKLIPIKDIIAGNRIIMCDDSIVRGTQLKNFTIQKLHENNAREIHIRISCPPLMFPCRYNLSTRNIDELAARRAIRALEGKHAKDVSEYIDHTSKKYKKMVDWIKKDLGVDSLRYQIIDDMIGAIGLPKSSLCLYCWTGKGL